MSAALELAGVTKRFGATVALDAVDLAVAEREILVVLGPTGAGKTTLLRAIAGLETLDAGRVHFAGRDVTHATPAERDVALVFQNFSLYPSWTVRENLAFPLRAPNRTRAGRTLAGRTLAGRTLDERALDEREIATRVDAAAATLRIPHLLDRPARQLSGGEMQRVAIGRAIVRRPKLFLMDEPLTNLDAKLRESLRVELVELVRSLGTPLVYVTHDQAEALSMGDRVAVLSQGRVLQVGDPRSVYLAPVSPLVARQLGAPPINLFEARWRDGWWRSADDVPLAPAAAPTRVFATLGVRPEHVAPDGGPLAARVEVVEDTGPTRVLLLALGAAHVHLLVPRHFQARVGDELRPRFDPERVLVWPSAD